MTEEGSADSTFSIAPYCEVLKAYINKPIECVKNEVHTTICPFVQENIIKNPYLNLPYLIVSQSNNKNSIVVRLNEQDFPITYQDRRMAVFTLMTLSTVFFYKRRSDVARFKFRWFIPFYVFYSLLICRENLNPNYLF